MNAVLVEQDTMTTRMEPVLILVMYLLERLKSVAHFIHAKEYAQPGQIFIGFITKAAQVHVITL